MRLSEQNSDPLQTVFGAEFVQERHSDATLRNLPPQERTMHILAVVRTAIDAVRNAMRGARWDSEFTCGDCERKDRCSLPPNDNCIAKAEQMARGDWKSKKRYKRLAEQFGYW